MKVKQIYKKGKVIWRSMLHNSLKWSCLIEQLIGVLERSQLRDSTVTTNFKMYMTQGSRQTRKSKLKNKNVSIPQQSYN